MTEAPLRTVSCLVVAALSMVLAGCGDLRLPGFHGSASARPVGQDGPAADSSKVAVIRTWARELQRGDVRAAAQLFHLPSVFSDGAPTLRLSTLQQAEVANASLTCGATFISAFAQGRYVNALFRLTDRPGAGGGANRCGAGVGDTARVDFLIQGGQIVQWLRAPSRAGDPGAPTTSTATPTAPTPTAPGPSGSTI